MANLSDIEYRRLCGISYTICISNGNSHSESAEIKRDLVHDAWYSYSKYSRNHPEDTEQKIKLISFHIKQAWIKRFCKQRGTGTLKKWIKTEINLVHDLRPYENHLIDAPRTSLEAITDTISKKRYQIITKKRKVFKSKIIEVSETFKSFKILGTYNYIQKIKDKNGKIREYPRIAIREHKSYTKIRGSPKTQNSRTI